MLESKKSLLSGNKSQVGKKQTKSFLQPSSFDSTGISGTLTPSYLQPINYEPIVNRPYVAIDPNCIYFTIEAVENDPFWFFIVVNDDGGPNLTGVVTWGDDSTADTFTIAPDSGVFLNHTFLRAGSYSGSLRVDDPSRIYLIQATIND
jgi:hypothetical protein